MQNLIDSNEFKQNESGGYSRSQVRALILWFLRYVPIFCIAGFGLAYSLPNIWRIVAIFGTIVMLAIYLWLYGADLLQSSPVFTVGKVIKEVRKFRGPTRYDVLVGENSLRIRALNKAQWLMLQNGMSYKIYYSPRTKWMLSYKQLSDDNS